MLSHRPEAGAIIWIYDQASGQLSQRIAVGYSGAGEGKNNPAMQDVQNVGPIPQGAYSIGDPHDTATHGPFVLALTSDRANDMHGRSEFLIHGDSFANPGTASHGCIVLPRKIREQIWRSGDTKLEVV